MEAKWTIGPALVNLQGLGRTGPGAAWLMLVLGVPRGRGHASDDLDQIPSKSSGSYRGTLHLD